MSYVEEIRKLAGTLAKYSHWRVQISCLTATKNLFSSEPEMTVMDNFCIVVSTYITREFIEQNSYM